MTNPLGKNIYLSFDVLYDTRLGTVATLSDELAGKLITDKRYKLRICDDFTYADPTWDHKAYMKAYERRGINELMLAPMSDLLLSFRDILDDINKSIAPLLGDEVEDRPVIFVNYWPYVDLQDNEIEVFQDSIRAHCGGLFEYKMICVPANELNMNWWRDNGISIGFIYDYSEWHANILNGVNTNNIPAIPQTTLTFCKRVLDMNKFKTLLEYKTPAGEHLDPFNEQTRQCSLFIGVRWLTSNIFSAADISLHLKR